MLIKSELIKIQKSMSTQLWLEKYHSTIFWWSQGHRRSFQGHLVSDLLLQHIAATLFMSLTVKVTTEQKNVTFPPARKCFSHPPGAGFYGKKHFLAGGNVTPGNIFSRTKMFSCDRHPMGGWWSKYIHSLVPFEAVIEYGWFRQ